MGAGRPLHRFARERRASARPARVPPRRRLRPQPRRRERARPQVRRRLPPGRGGRREADRRATRTHARDEPPGHGGRARPLHPLRASGCSSRPRRRSTATTATRRRSTRTARRVYGPTTQRRWAYADSKAMDEFLALAHHSGARTRLHHRAALQHRRAAADRGSTGWSSRASSSARSGRAARGLRRRGADALLLPRGGHDSRPARA